MSIKENLQSNNEYRPALRRVIWSSWINFEAKTGIIFANSIIFWMTIVSRAAHSNQSSSLFMSLKHSNWEASSWLLALMCSLSINSLGIRRVFVWASTAMATTSLWMWIIWFGSRTVTELLMGCWMSWGGWGSCWWWWCVKLCEEVEWGWCCCCVEVCEVRGSNVVESTKSVVFLMSYATIVGGYPYGTTVS